MNFIDLAEQQHHIRKELEQNISGVLDHGKYINGPEVQTLEKKLAEYAGVSFSVGCASGTDALLMSLMAYGINRGDAIFTSPFTFIATAEVIKLLNATPVFVDIDPDTFNIDAKKLKSSIENIKNEGKLTPKGIIPVDIFGQPADYDEINSLAEKYNLFVLEDAAQSFGGRYKGRKACSLAHVAATSFFPAKPLGCYGDGGMIFTDNRELYDKLISIRVHGKGKDKYDNVRVGLNGRLDTLQAAILLAKFEIFDNEIRLRQETARRYDEGLKDLCQTPLVKDFNLSAWAQYSIMHRERDMIINHLKSKDIPTAIYYPKPLHLQGAFTHLGYGRGDFPVSEQVSDNIFSLPMHPYLKSVDQKRIIAVIHEALA